MQYRLTMETEATLDCPACEMPMIACKCKGGGRDVSHGDEDDVKKYELQLSAKQGLQQIIAITEDVDVEEDALFNPDSPNVNHVIMPELLIMKFALLGRETLTLISDKESGIFSLELSCKPSALSAEQRVAMNAYFTQILQLLSEYKTENNIQRDCAKVTKDAEGNYMSLHIMLSPEKLYTDFINRLAEKHMLPIQAFHRNENIVTEENSNIMSSLFDIRPTPENTSKSDEESDEVMQSEMSEVSAECSTGPACGPSF